MSPFVLTPIAKRYIRSIWLFIARDSPRHATLVREAIFATCGLAAEYPQTGHPRLEFAQDKILFLAVTRYDRYTVAYDPGTSPLRILRILHGARDFAKLRPY